MDPFLFNVPSALWTGTGIVVFLVRISLSFMNFLPIQDPVLPESSNAFSRNILASLSICTLTLMSNWQPLILLMWRLGCLSSHNPHRTSLSIRSLRSTMVSLVASFVHVGWTQWFSMLIACSAGSSCSLCATQYSVSLGVFAPANLLCWWCLTSWGLSVFLCSVCGFSLFLVLVFSLIIFGLAGIVLLGFGGTKDELLGVFGNLQAQHVSTE